jgi:hypothetical protein
VTQAPSEHARITRRAIAKRLFPVIVAGLALYGLAPKLGELWANAGSQFDPAVVATLMEIIRVDSSPNRRRGFGVSPDEANQASGISFAPSSRERGPRGPRPLVP